MFRIKICGITNVDDATAAVEAGADAIGLNFYAKSVRHIDVAAARRITDALYDWAGDRRDKPKWPDNLIYPVGVFVNHTADEVRQAFSEARLVVAQLHGDEPPSMVGELADVIVLRVQRWHGHGLAQVADDLAACREAASAAGSKMATPCGVLLDAAATGAYGGTGTALPWNEIASDREQLGDTPLILAGGLTPDNVAEAIRIVRPHAVDVASGVESAPGKKDPHKVRDFIQAAKAAFGI
jgi:phosphoribosylanthranilate isomerase